MVLNRLWMDDVRGVDFPNSKMVSYPTILNTTKTAYGRVEDAWWQEHEEKANVNGDVYVICFSPGA